MKPLHSLVALDQALELISAAIIPVERTENISVSNALGRVLAEDTTATQSTPPFDRATMDGYAVLASDIASVAPARTLQVVEEIFAGTISKKTIESGQAAYIATGARLPGGADTVVMVEDTERKGSLVDILRYCQKGANITREGSDIKAGEVVLKAYTTLNAARIGVLASQGLSEITVFAKPIVAILPTGSELTEPGKKLKEGQIYDINSHTLAAVVAQSGGEPRVLPIASDDQTGIRTSLEKALSGDLLVTSGGSSVGEKDFVAELLEEMGDIKFHGVKLKPGKPSAFAVVKGKPVIGMPGYPTSCLMNAYVLLAPAVRRMARLPDLHSVTIEAILGENVKGASGRPMFLPVRLESGKAYSVFKDSGAITSMALAEGYVAVAPDAELPHGSPVQVILF